MPRKVEGTRASSRMKGVEPFRDEYTDEQLNEVLSYLKAWPFSLIQAALKLWRVEGAAERAEMGWRIHAGSFEEIPNGHHWRQVGKLVYIKDSKRVEAESIESRAALVARVKATLDQAKSVEEIKDFLAAGGKIEETKTEPPAGRATKTDLSASAVDDLKCPKCGGDMFKEGICPGCADGRKGYRVRLLCGECDFTALL